MNKKKKKKENLKTMMGLLFSGEEVSLSPAGPGYLCEQSLALKDSDGLS